MKLNWANQFTILRILLIVPFVSCMLKVNDPILGVAMRYVSFAIFMLMVAGDAFDGYLARKKKMATKLGAFLDPVADKLLITSACLLLASQRGHVEVVAHEGRVQDFLLPPTVVVFIIGKDLLLLIGFLIVYFITSRIYIAPVLIGKVANDLQLSMVAGILLGPEISSFLPGWIWFLQVLWWSAAGTAVLALIIYIRNGVRYYEEYEQTNS